MGCRWCYLCSNQLLRNHLGYIAPSFCRDPKHFVPDRHSSGFLTSVSVRRGEVSLCTDPLRQLLVSPRTPTRTARSCCYLVGVNIISVAQMVFGLSSLHHSIMHAFHGTTLSGVVPGLVGAARHSSLAPGGPGLDQAQPSNGVASTQAHGAGRSKLKSIPEDKHRLFVWKTNGFTFRCFSFFRLVYSYVDASS